MKSSTQMLSLEVNVSDLLSKKYIRLENSLDFLLLQSPEFELEICSPNKMLGSVRSLPSS